jgi:hypothetical protein
MMVVYTVSKILTIGLSTLERSEESYITKCIDSIIKDAVNSGYIDDIRIEVQDCDIGFFDPKPIVELKVKYGKLCENGTLNFFKVDHTRYPDFTQNNPSLGDTPEDAAWRSKLCFDASLLIEHCIGLSPYYLHLEDDILVEKGFFDLLFSSLYTYANNKWSMMFFGKTGTIGQLYKSSDLEKLFLFVQAFYDEMPLDYLTSIFCHVKQISGYEALNSGEKLLTHIGVNSTNRSVVRPMEKFN